MSDLVDTIGEFADLFEHFGIPYCIMGGWAVRLYGLPRPTYDIDFTIAIDRSQLPRLYDEAEERGFTVPEPFRGGWVDSVADMPLVKFRLPVEGHGIDIDIFLAESEYQQEIIRRRRIHDFRGRPIAFVSPEDLVLLKLIAARTRDLADIEDVMLAQPALDEAYLRHWAGPLGVAEKLEAALRDRP